MVVVINQASRKTSGAEEGASRLREEFGEGWGRN